MSTIAITTYDLKVGDYLVLGEEGGDGCFCMLAPISIPAVDTLRFVELKRPFIERIGKEVTTEDVEEALEFGDRVLEISEVNVGWMEV